MLDTTQLRDSRAQLDEYERLEAELCRRILRKFVEKVWPIIEPGLPFVPNWHIDAICCLLEEVTKGNIERIIFNIPPGCMKSLLINVIWPAWEWASNPGLRFLSASYGSDLSIRDNQKLRDIVKSDWYQKHFNVQFTGDQDAKEKFETTKKGWSIATSVDGSGTGEHPDRIRVDDPLSAKQALSKIKRDSAIKWIRETLMLRGASRNARIVIVMQRLHQDDPSGILLSKESGWTHVCFPMHYIPETIINGRVYKPHPMDPRTVPGQLLWPELFDAEKVRKLEAELGEYGIAGQMQQQPSPEGGGLFKREWFNIIHAVPSDVYEWVRGYDTAATMNDGDFTRGVKMGKRPGPRFVIAHAVGGQLGPAGVDALILGTAIADGRNVKIAEEKEGGSAGVSIIQKRAQLLAGFNYKGIPLTGDKKARANNLRAQAEVGNVDIVAGAWTEEYLDELCNFPNASHDDYVDASSCAFNELTLGPAEVQFSQVGLG